MRSQGAPVLSKPRESRPADALASVATSAESAPAAAAAAAQPGEPAGVPMAGAVAGDPEVRCFRGRSVTDVIPQIQAELGGDAIVVARRAGLEGGIGGFFQRPFVELQAKPGGPGIDLRDGEAVLPEPLADEEQGGPGAEDEPGHAPGLPPAEHFDPSFAGVLAAAGAAYEPAPAERADAIDDDEPAAAVARRRSRAHAALRAELERAGLGPELAAELVAAAETYTLALAPRLGLRRAVRQTLAQAIPQAPPPPTRGCAILVVGPGGAGKSALVEALAERIGGTGAMTASPAALTFGGSAGEIFVTMAPKLATPLAARSKRALGALAKARAAGGALLIDTPALSPAQRPAIRELARYADELSPERVIVALPATLGAGAASQLLEALSPLRPSAVAITHADETDQLGVAVHAACAFGLAPELELAGGADARSLARLGPTTLAERLLP